MTKFCFKIQLFESFFNICTGDEDIKIGKDVFVGKGNVEVVKFCINDAGQDQLIFVIYQSQELLIKLGSEVSIYIVRNGLINHLRNMVINKIEHDGRYIITLHSHIVAKNMLNYYSQTCRASLGDAQCGAKVGINVNITHVDETNIYLDNNLDDMQYVLGTFISGSFKSVIIEHQKNRITILEKIGDNLRTAVLMPVCDKTIATCYNRFGNVKNFRGEPFGLSFLV